MADIEVIDKLQGDVILIHMRKNFLAIVWTYNDLL